MIVVILLILLICFIGGWISLFICLFFEAGSHHVVYTGLELLILLPFHPSDRIIDVCHHTKHW